MVDEVKTKHWAFTFDDYTKYHIEELEKLLAIESFTSKYIFGEKIKDSIPSMRGYIVFKTSKSRKELEHIFRVKLNWQQVHNIKFWIRSCVDEGRVYKLKNVQSYELRDQSIDKHFITDDILDEEEFYEWQRELLRVIHDPANDRVIHWYWDSKGGTGKSIFAKYLVKFYNACLVQGDDYDETIARINNHKYCELVIIDIPRNRGNNVNYSALVSIKNGIINQPGRSTVGIIKSPHVIVFSNLEPNMGQLSLDRWNIVDLGEADLGL